MRNLAMTIAVAAALAACATPTEETVAAEAAVVGSSSPLMTWGELTGRPLPAPSSTHAYGDDPAQVADLWLPDGPSPHPVVLMVHGGCWQKAIADRTLMNYAAEDLRRRGLAVWNVEYRGVDEAGGGYPGTYLDVARAAEHLREAGPELGLDTGRVAAVGHSAGGHLVAWLATQGNIAEASPLAGEPLDYAAVVVSGGLADLEASEPVTLPSCLADIRSDLVGRADAGRADVYADTSPARLLPARTPLVSVNGERDRIAPPQLGIGFTELARAAGGDARYIEIPGAGHVELVAPGTEAWNAQARRLVEALRP